MPEVTRYDRAQITLPPRVTDEGFLLVVADAAKPGVMQYRTGDGRTRLELIPEDELHEPGSLATLAWKPVTLEHPDSDVTPDNHRDNAIGSVGEEIEVVEEGGYVRVKMIVRDRAAIDAIRSGKAEVSPGYRVTMDETPGTHPVFGRYDAVQRRRRYNHLAVVDIARGGPDIRLRLDSACQIVDSGPTTTEPPMTRVAFLALLAAASVPPEGVVRADAKDADPVDPAEVKAFADVLEKRADSKGLKAAFDAMLGEYDGMARKMAAKDAELEKMKGELAEAKKAKPAADGDMCGTEEEMDAKADSFKGLAPWMKRRAQLLDLATEHGVKLDAADGLSNAKIAREIAKAVNTDLRADASDEYVRAVVDLLPRTKPAAVASPYIAALGTEHRRADAKVEPAKADTRTLSEISRDSYGPRAGANA